MFRRMFKLFDDYMVKTKRKIVIVDRMYNVVMYRYSLTIRDVPGKGIVSSWPRVYINHWKGAYLEEAHSHRGNSYSLMLKGEYTEYYEGKVIKRTPGSFHKVTYPKEHKVTNLQPDTWTIFALGFFKESENQTRKTAKVRFFYATPENEEMIRAKRDKIKRRATLVEQQ